MRPPQTEAEQASSLAATRLIAETARPLRPALVVATVAGLCWRLCGWAIPVVVGIALERGVSRDDPLALWLGVAGIVVLAGLAAGMAMARHRHAAVPAAQSAVNGRAAVLDTAHHTDGVKRQTHPPGDALARATSDVDRVRQMIDFLPTSTASVLILLVMLIALVVSSAALGALIAVPLLGTVALIWRRSVHAERQAGALQGAIGGAMDLAEASATSFRAIAGLGVAAELDRRWTVAVEGIRSRALRVARTEARYEPLVNLAVAVALVAGVWGGGHQLLAGSVGLGTVIAALGWSMYMSNPLQQIGQGFTWARRARASARRLADFHGAPVLVDEPVEPAEVPADGPLQLELSGVAILRGGHTVVDEVSFVVACSEVVAVVSTTGGGKSSVAALLDRRIDPDRGAVLIGGVDARQWPLDGLRRAVRVVGRGEFVFGGSIAHNVTFGRPAAMADEVDLALRRAGALDVVESKGGLDGPVGTAGRSLSGGQRQRLALARAWLDPPGVLVLDEATAAVDPRREAEILDAARAAGVTLVLFTSRASVASRADRVLLLEHGRLTAEGTHDHLSRHHPGYRDLVEERVEVLS